MKDGAIVANAGHFNIELDLLGLQKMSVGKTELRKNLDGYRLPDGRMIAVIADGGLCNIAAADGHPVEIMDMSFALQALGAEYLLKNQGRLDARVYDIPAEVDHHVALLKLKAFGGAIDTLNGKQTAYLAGH